MTPSPNSSPDPLTEGAPSFSAIAFKASTDMLAAIVVGTALGYFFDQQMNSAHWGLIIGFFLGSAAGLLNVYRGLCKIGYGFKKSGR